MIIAGSRTFNGFDLLKREADKVIADHHGKDLGEVTIISGGARGADKLGEQYANMNLLDLEIYPAKWDKYGRSAGYRRNEQMAKVATHLLAFWNGHSRGTKHMIDLAHKHGLHVHTVIYDD
jgi:hypothetical protein